ncbi:MAG TPA: CDP-glycerol glycerophosphotransferase family protein [Candidatus Limnocylindrales bacterium]|nr:CDP-glycerol glycerophosphotransferase family protein [Candidatus Limnocylindrales bacterium]
MVEPDHAQSLRSRAVQPTTLIGGVSSQPDEAIERAVATDLPVGESLDTDAAALGGDEPIELTDLSWRRIQLILRFRAGDGRPVDPDRLWLRNDDPARRPMPPTGTWTEGGETFARYNVMLGTNQVPLSPGRWTLGSSVLMAATPVVAGRLEALPVGRFPLQAVEYRVVPAVDPASRQLSLSISLDAIPVAPDRRSITARVKARIRWLGRRAQKRGFRWLLRVSRAVSPHNGRRILFTSNSRPALGGNLALVHRRMVERGLHRSFELRALFKPGITARRPVRDRLRLAWLIARADVIFVDDYHPVVYGLRDPKTRIVQLWHAYGSFKTFDYSRVGKPGAPSPYLRDHKNYAFVTVGSEEDVVPYAEAFLIPEERVVPTGVPRMDAFVEGSRRPGVREAALAPFPQAVGKKVILFAPTFRGHGGRSATYPASAVDLAALHEVCVEKDAVCVIRLHPHVKASLPIPAAFRDRILEDRGTSTDVPDLLYATDLLVTDYSSILFEYAALGRPMLFYAFDLDDYRATRDFYVDYESFVPGRIVRTFGELVEAIRHDDYQQEKVEPFARRYLARVDGRAADRIIDLVLES